MGTVINIPITGVSVRKFPRQGHMINNYVPFKNLIINKQPSSEDFGFAISNFRTTNLGYSHKLPLEIDIQNYPDGSVNLIINDDLNKPKLINSRFSTLENFTFTIPDHSGNKDTSLYDENNLNLDASLYKNITQIPKIIFDGLDSDGYFPCGTYHFYFKLSDNDGNESDFIGESSSVVCHIGKINDPFSMRMGMENENSEKRVLFTLSNLDETYDNVVVYYSRVTSGEEESDLVTYHRILDGFPIKNGICKLQLHGKEPAQLVTLQDINPMYYYCDHVKTQAICQNRLCLGNIQEQYVDYEQLKNLSLYITAKPDISEPFSNVNFLYKSYVDTDYAHGYYNAKNIYYRTGYWPEEYYRFGIVFMLENYSLTSVFNIRGGDLSAPDVFSKIPLDSSNIVKYDDAGFLLDENGNKISSENAFGIYKMPSENAFGGLLGIEFSIPEGVLQKLQDLGIKGYFFVRQNRKPIIIGQGVAIGKTSKDFGNIPVLKDHYQNKFFTESFLKKKTSKQGYELIQERDIIYPESKNVTIQAAIVPEAVVREPLYNQIFLGQNFSCSVVGIEQEKNGFTRASKYRYTTNTRLPDNDEIKNPFITTLLNIPSGVKIKTNGQDYYSSQAGVAEDVSTFISVLHDWKHEGNPNIKVGAKAHSALVSENLSDCIPFQLKQDQVVRGVFGAYVGLGEVENDTLHFGDVFNIRHENYNPDDPDWMDQQVILRSYDKSAYYAISDRFELNTNQYTAQHTCFRGDCYICPFTHRIIRNHIDPELPTNDKIVDITAWNDNFLVLTKAQIEDQESQTGYRYINEVVPLFKARNKWYIDENGNAVNLQGQGAAAMFASLFTFGLNNLNENNHNEIWEKDLSELQWGDGSNVVILLPNDSKFAKAGGIGETFGMPNTWYEYGTRKISRSDINSIGLGHWLTVFVRSNINLCLRDIDKYQLSEKVIFNKERGFYPLYPTTLESEYKLPESKLINGACNTSLSKKAQTILPEIPYIKQYYDTRIVFSDVYNGGWKNGFRVFQSKNYQDLPKTYGALVKLVEFGGNLIGVMEHGIVLIPVNERTIAAAGDGGGAYINTDIVLPQNPNVISGDIGSLWGQSVLKTPTNCIYGVDTSTKKIWRIKDGQLECISDFKLQRFLNDNISLKEWDKACEIGFRDVKTHYNNFKKDVMFVFYNDDKQWHICFNEYLQTFTTFYSWAPSYSANINNTFITLDLEDSKNNVNTYNNFARTNLYKTYNKLGVNVGFNGKDLSSEDYICYIIDNDTLTSPTLRLQAIYNKCSSDKNPFYFKQSANLDVTINHICSLYNPLFHDDNKYFNLTKIPFNGGVDFEISLKNDPSLIEELKTKKYVTCKIQIEYWDLVQNKNGDIEEQFKTDFVLYRINNSDEKLTNLLWKHGQSGIYDGQHEILPTNWYNKQEPFEFEFIVQENQWQQLLFNNLLISSNNVKPEEIQFEIIGDSYDWWKYKDVINFVNKISSNEEELQLNYLQLLTYTQQELHDKIWPEANYPMLKDKQGSTNYTIKSIPYISHIRRTSLGEEYNKFSDNTTNVQLVYDDLLPEKHIRTTQKCNDMKQWGRIKGNMEYKEDTWVTDIRHLNFKIAYSKNNILQFKKLDYAKLRDKYVKVKIKYSGKDLAVIRGVLTLLDISSC